MEWAGGRLTEAGVAHTSRERRDGRETESKNRSGAAPSLEIRRTERTRIWNEYTVGSRSAPAALQPNTRLKKKEDARVRRWEWDGGTSTRLFIRPVLMYFLWYLVVSWSSINGGFDPLVPDLAPTQD
jgi:hypothetical protein